MPRRSGGNRSPARRDDGRGLRRRRLVRPRTAAGRSPAAGRHGGRAPARRWLRRLAGRGRAGGVGAMRGVRRRGGGTAMNETLFARLAVLVRTGLGAVFLYAGV